MQEAVKVIDIKIIAGRRNEEQQTAAFEAGNSQVEWPDSTHNTDPSEGVDVAPYPIVWDDRERFTLMAGVIMGIAHTMGIVLRWGGDWDRDTEVKDNHFDDLGHFELVLPLDLESKV
jgi:peptidoglycan L-alanyl-D-glutamate endopeptidase CwlK